MNRCLECNKELSIYRFGLCSECDEKTKKGEMKYIILFVIICFALIFGFRILWAKIVYNDLRCAVAECRIIK